MKLVFTGGGTGGHFFPVIAIIRDINGLNAQMNKDSKKKKDINFFYIGPKDYLNLELERVLVQEQVVVKNILAGKIRRYLGFGAFFKNFIDIFKNFIGTFQAFFILFFLAPDAIFSKGGYGAVPVMLAARLLKIPIFIHESDVVPGLSNRLFNKYASKIFLSFPGTEIKISKPEKVSLVGNPIRKGLLEGSSEEAKKIFNLTFEKPIIFIIGGSQGAQKINDAVLNSLPQLLNDFELIHQTGTSNFKQIIKEAEVMIKENVKKYYHPFPFLKETELKHAYAVADLIISRAGSGTIFEIAALKKPSILIPLDGSAQNHQVKNAYAYSKDRATLVVEENNLSSNFFLQIIRNIIQSPNEKESMKKAAEIFARPNAANEIAKYILKYLYQ
jgi:UDP-N-acetylglucosamine--N-acetylmuramyl-(pentapeptide) pyrophosphoryl-undecaprenol N-acetylglucosamine transferase